MYGDVGFLEFQSTLPQRERLYHGYILHQSHYFNPRSHKGSDVVAIASIALIVAISIHAPTKGATISDNLITLL